MVIQWRYLNTSTSSTVLSDWLIVALTTIYFVTATKDSITALQFYAYYNGSLASWMQSNSTDRIEPYNINGVNVCIVGY